MVWCPSKITELSRAVSVEHTESGVHPYVRATALQIDDGLVQIAESEEDKDGLDTQQERRHT